MLLDMARCFVASAPGTGPISVGAAVPGFQTFVAAGSRDGLIYTYNATDYDGTALPGFPFGTETSWEVGTGVFSSTGTAFARTPLFSTNGNAATNLSANAHLWVTALASDFADTVALGIAAAGSSQGTATVLTAQFNEVTTVTSGAGVIVPIFMSFPGQQCKVAAYGANPLLAYPLSGQSFMSGGVNNGLNEALTVQVGTVLYVECVSPTVVYTIP